MAARITMDLLRKRAEHNECEITTLEEISLHQQDLERIELLDTACRDLKILYLQNNLISKIEHVTRLRQLEYINLALNNVKKVEGLEGCEMLNKLDLTVNFVHDLTSIKSLQVNRNLHLLYLTGNPCTSFANYREYVINTLPQLQELDGVRISRTDRILAAQRKEEIEAQIVKDSERAVRKEEERVAKLQARKEKKAGFNGSWYCDTQNTAKKEAKIVELGSSDESEEEEELDPEEEAAFWKEEEDFTPESRYDTAVRAKKQREAQEAKKAGRPLKKKRKKRKFFKADGKPLNMNDSGLQFELLGQLENGEPLVLDLHLYKYLDTSQIDLDVQPTYIRAIIKEKVFQLALPEEVSPDRSKAERSKITGHLMVTMPKAGQELKLPMSAPLRQAKAQGSASGADDGAVSDAKKASQRELLDVPDKPASGAVDVGSIVSDAAEAKRVLGRGRREKVAPRENDPDFVDDNDVPPLE
eukprot:m.47083 g.47083  ORF g.47083 m.47083 type:complete len:472 (-) comp6842_c0_seq2:183-1598(-)